VRLPGIFSGRKITSKPEETPEHRPSSGFFFGLFYGILPFINGDKRNIPIPLTDFFSEMRMYRNQRRIVD
jgi:hypothetical protein